MQNNYVSENFIESRKPPVLRSAGWSIARVAGTAWLTAWIISGLGILWFLAYSNDVVFSFGGPDGFGVTADPKFLEKYGPKLISGFETTLKLVAISIGLGALLSIPMTAMRMSKNRVLYSIAYGYVYFVRGTPLIAQIFLIYYGAGSFRPFLQDINLWWFFRDAWYCAVLALTLNTSAYQVEILRGSIQNMPKGQWEAAAALGLPKWLTFWKIILPQALIVSLRPYGNEIVLMIKGSAIVAIITILDLMGETRRAFSRTYDFQSYIWAAIMYLIMVETLRQIWEKIEQRLTRHLRR
ncbi:ABC transporter permease [Rhodobacteraceae bacterium RKSG542]|uniref:ABC transporter permease n=1 Tax=Pseudovibrio flavus TaxID=2529854 RepID=UPI0012BC8B56|nr:ABC transporter permease [Pseudovibrio flavus]MTI16977.1 ABC transporter permease [Pseudovibrio flavus]